MAITTRDQFKDYCLRRLGYPVIEINVDEDQLEDRVQDAIQFWQEYHFDGYERTYLKAQITASTLKLVSGGNAFAPSEIITGATSGAQAQVHVIESDSVLLIKRVSGTFANNEVITGAASGAVAATTLTNAFTLGNWDTQYFDIAENVIGVTRMFRVGTGATGSGTNNIFDIVYQFRMNDMYNLLSADMTYYAQMKTYLDQLDMLFVGEREIRFNRKTNRLYVDTNWYDTFTPGDFVVIDAFVIIDPDQFAEVYEDIFLKRYATALIKRQWGANLKKFQGIQLPGGVILNGDKIFQEAQDEILQIEQEMQLRYELPIDFYTG